MSKYTDKFLAMIRRLEVKHRRDVDEYEADGFDVLASAARDEVADWRAMREAWELLTESASTVVEQYEGLGVRLEAMARLKHALTKARGE